MRILIASILTSIITTATFAQTPDKVIARVHYTYINKYDTIGSGKIRTENMLLFIGKNASLYTSYDQLRHQLAIDQKIRSKMMTMVNDGRPKIINVDERGNEWMSKINHLHFFNEKKYYIKENVSDQDYLVKQPFTEVKWKITKDTLSFSGVQCQKATTTIEGKNWTAWFAPSLPFQSGPWLLNGLPGLIVDAHNENKNIHFQFAGIENANEGDFMRINDVTKKPNADPGDINAIDIMLGFDIANAYFSNTIKLPNRAIKTTKAELEKFKIALEKDKKGIQKTQSSY